MAATDPKTTLRTILTGVTATKDDDITPASIILLWERGGEGLKYLFFTANYDVVITIGEPSSRSMRPVQDKPVHYLMSYPVTVTTVDKSLASVIVCTATRMQYKVAYSIRTILAAAAQSAPGASPVYTLEESTDKEQHRRVGGLDIWEATHLIEYLKGEN